MDDGWGGEPGDDDGDDVQGDDDEMRARARLRVMTSWDGCQRAVLGACGATALRVCD